MLKITMLDGEAEHRLVVEGRLTQPEIPTLRSAWESALKASHGCGCIVDLRGATHIDPSGERVLLEMKEQGARFIACGLSTTHRLAQIGIACENQARSRESTGHHSKRVPGA